MARKNETTSVKGRMGKALASVLERLGYKVSGTEIREETAAGHIALQGVKITGPRACTVGNMIAALPTGTITAEVFGRVMTAANISRYQEMTDEAARIYDGEGREAFRAYTAAMKTERDAILSGEG